MLNRIAVSEFQFHNGTINTELNRTKVDEVGVSIPQRYN